MPRFRKAADKDFVIIPEAGRVVPGQVLSGLQWRRYVELGLLEEIPDSDVQISLTPITAAEEESLAAEVNLAAEVTLPESLMPDPPLVKTELELKMERRSAARRKGIVTTT